LKSFRLDRNEDTVQPTPPISTAVQPIPLPVAPPPTIPDEHYHWGTDDEPPFDVDEDRRARRRALLARLLGVLGILLTLGFAAVTVGRTWLRSLPSVVWPASLPTPEPPALPSPLAPLDEPVLPAPSLEPAPAIPPVEVAPPPAPSAMLESAPPEMASTVERPEPARGRPAPRPEPETSPPDRTTPEDLPAAPTVDPASPLAPPAGEAPAPTSSEADSVFGED
jgi:hypothetical protein